MRLPGIVQYYEKRGYGYGYANDKSVGAGLLLLGIGALALGVLNHLLLHIIYESDVIWMAVTVGCVLLGVVLTGFGVKLINKTGASVAEMTAKDSGCQISFIMESCGYRIWLLSGMKSLRFPVMTLVFSS